jgi:hypothetical protein
MATAVGATCTGDEEAHQIMLTRMKAHSPIQPRAGARRGGLGGTRVLPVRESSTCV